MRIMCDTNVLVRSAISPTGSARELIHHIERSHVLLTSIAQLRELLDVLRRPSIVALHKLDERGIRRIVTKYSKSAEVIPLPPYIPPIVAADPKDNPIVATAIAGAANVFCTLDRHLRAASVVSYFAEHGVRVLTDAELLRELRQTP